MSEAMAVAMRLVHHRTTIELKLQERLFLLIVFVVEGKRICSPLVGMAGR
jgi:hypothetical protein